MAIMVRYIVIGLIFLSVRNVFAQQKTTIGLTLSGGGARGLAHIGLLKAIDSSGLKIDYITGTSMGSIIGSLYAIGYSADSIEKIARTLDWDILLSNTPDMRIISIEEKFEFQRYAVELPFTQGKIGLPSGVIEGEELWLKFFELYAPVYSIKDFSQFSIPFACIGTDVVNGKPVLLHSGEITKAIRSSMAIPSVFSAVPWDTLLLVDGGVVKNFPVEDVRAMGADYVIGIDISTPNLKQEEMKSALDIMMQIAFYTDAVDIEKEKKLCDLYIKPNLEYFTTADFDKGQDIVDLGIKEGLKWYPYFKHLADSLQHYQDTATRLPTLTRLKVEDISVQGISKTTESFFIGRTGLTTGTEYTIQDINEAVRKVFGTRSYKSVTYAIEPKENGSVQLKFNVQEHPLTYIKLGVHYDTYTSIGIIANITSRNFGIKNSRCLASIKIGEYSKLRVQYYKYLGQYRTWGFELNGLGEYTKQTVYSNDFRATSEYLQLYFHAEAKFQRILNRSSTLGIAYRREMYSINPKIEGLIALKGKSAFNYWYAYYEYNTLNNKIFPTKGSAIQVEAGYVMPHLSSVIISQDGIAIIDTDTLKEQYIYGDYIKVSIQGDKYITLHPKHTVLVNMYSGYFSNPDQVFLNQYILGGIIQNNRSQIPIVGLLPTQIRANSFSVLHLGYQYELFKNIFITPRFNSMLYDYRFDKQFQYKWFHGMGATIGYASGIGPMHLTMMYSPQIKKVYAFVSIGFHF